MIDQDRMMAFRSEMQSIGDLDRVSGTQMLFAFQRFAAIVLDGDAPVTVTPTMTATSSDDVPAPATQASDVTNFEPETPDETTPGEDSRPVPLGPAVAPFAEEVPDTPESDPAEPEEPAAATEAQPDPLTEAAP
jgi:hypothetical protein